MVLSLTDKGHDLLGRYRVEVAALEEQMLSGLTAGEGGRAAPQPGRVPGEPFPATGALTGPP